MKTSFNKFIYIGFILYGIFALLVRKSAGEASIYWGLALAFDPFDQEMSWKIRPTWQKVILMVHLLLVFVLLGYTIGGVSGNIRNRNIEGWKLLPINLQDMYLIIF